MKRQLFLEATMVFALTSMCLYGQPRPPISVEVSVDSKARPASLSAQWTALDVRSKSGVDFVLRERLPKSPKHLLVYLDGGGSVGHDNFHQLRYPAMIALFESPDFADTIVLLPQCPVSMAWDSFLWNRSDGPYAASDPSELGESLIGLVTSLQETYGITRENSLIWGISHGAFGLLDCVTWHPEVFGSIVSLSGGGDPRRLAETQTHTNIWLFHGSQDSNVPPYHSQRIAAALTERGIPYHFTLLPGANHSIMELVLSDATFMSYLKGWASFKHS